MMDIFVKVMGSLLIAIGIGVLVYTIRNHETLSNKD